MGSHPTATAPSALYGVVLLMAAIAYVVLQHAIIATEGRSSRLAAAVGVDGKGKLSPVLYLSAIGATAWAPWLAQAIYAGVALLWLVPDRRIERVLHDETPGG
jgi:uncharacterized membrane protein